MSEDGTGEAIDTAPMKSSTRLLVLSVWLSLIVLGITSSTGGSERRNVVERAVAPQILGTSERAAELIEPRAGARSDALSLIATDSPGRAVEVPRKQVVPKAQTLRAMRDMQVLVQSPAGEPIGNLELFVERATAAGGWLKVRSGRTKPDGRLQFAGLEGFEGCRVRACLGSESEDSAWPAAETVRIEIERPGRARVELQSPGGIRLTGARRVEFSGASKASPARLVLTWAPEQSQWQGLIAGEQRGTLRVTDSLGRVWSAAVTLTPGETVVASPDHRWIAVARSWTSDRGDAPSIERGRLVWTLRIGSGRTRRGSGWLAPDGGFHAVVPREQALGQGGELELQWSAGDYDRALSCSWFPDGDLDLIELQPLPIGEVVSLSSPSF